MFIARSLNSMHFLIFFSLPLPQLTWAATVEHTEVHSALKVNESGTLFLLLGNHVTGEGQYGYSRDTMSKRLQGQQSGDNMHGCLCVLTHADTYFNAMQQTK